MSNFHRRLTISTCAAALLLVAPLNALSASPTTTQYGNPAATDLGPVANTGSTPSATDAVGASGAVSGETTQVKAEPQALAAGAATPQTVGALPFTGAELGVLLLAGLALFGAGAVLRRVSFGTRNRSRSTH